MFAASDSTAGGTRIGGGCEKGRIVFRIRRGASGFAPLVPACWRLLRLACTFLSSGGGMKCTTDVPLCCRRNGILPGVLFFCTRYTGRGNSTFARVLLSPC